MALSTVTKLDSEVLSFMLEVRHKQEKLSEYMQAKFGRPMQLDSKRERQFNMIRNKIKEAHKFKELANITEGERIELADFAHYILNVFHDSVGTPPEQRPSKDSYAQTFLG